MLKSGEEWTVIGTDDPMLVIKTLQGERVPSKEELERAINYLNEQNSYSVKIYCRNTTCSDKGAWIVRPVEDLKKTTYCCEVCHHPMER